MENSPNYKKLISLGAGIATIGFIMSGPVAFMLVNFMHPQPAWTSPKTFAENYNSIQDLPFYFGFLLIGGMLMLIGGHYLNFLKDNQKTKFHLLLSFAWTIVFSTLISFNYVCQTTFVHNLALNYRPENDFAIAAFSMSNPLSFCWANEMWGYGFLGIATLLMSGYYRGSNRFIFILLIANGIISLLSVIFTIVNVSWVMTTFGLISYFIWNLLMIVLISGIYLHHKTTTNENSVYPGTIP